MTQDDINKFHRAVQNGELAQVSLYLEQFPDFLNAPDAFKNTPLMKAAYLGYKDIVRLLLDKKADIELVNIEGLRALSGVIYKKGIDITRMLLGAGAEVNYIDGKDRSPLMHAVETNEDTMIPMLEMLVARGADVNSVNSKGTSALHQVGRYGNIAMCNFLIEKGANTFSSRNIADGEETSATPLMRAIVNGNTEVAKILIEKGGVVDIDRLSDESSKSTAAGFAIKCGETDILEIFLKIAPNLAKDPAAITTAAQEGHNKIVKMLLANRADKNAQNSKGNTALLLAINNQRIDVVLTLLQKDADITLTNNNSASPLMLLAERGEVLKAVLQTEFAEKIITTKIAAVYDNILLHAAAYGSVEIVRDLLEAGADIDHENQAHDTALTLAAWHGNVEVVDALIEAGANIHHKNIKNRNSLALALENYNNAEFALSQPSKIEEAKQVANLILNKMDIDERAASGNTLFLKYIVEGTVDKINFMLKNSQIDFRFIEDYINKQELLLDKASKKEYIKEKVELGSVKSFLSVVESNLKIISIQNALEMIDLNNIESAIKLSLDTKIRNEGTLDELSKLLEIELHYAPSIGYKLAFLTSQRIRGLDTGTLSEEAIQKLKLIDSIYRYEDSSKTRIGQPIDQIESAIDCFKSNAQDMVVDSVIFQNFRNIVQVIKNLEEVDPELNDILLKFDQFELFTAQVKQFCYKPTGKIAIIAKGIAASQAAEVNPFQVIKSKVGEFNRLPKGAIKKTELKQVILTQRKVVLDLLEEIAELKLRMVEVDITELLKLIIDVNNDLSKQPGLGDCLINHHLAPIAAKAKLLVVTAVAEEEGFDGEYTLENLKKYAKYVVSGKGSNQFCSAVEEGFVASGGTASAKSKTDFNVKLYRSASDVFASQGLDKREFKAKLSTITLASRSLTEDVLMKYMITSGEKGGDGILPAILDGIMSYVDYVTYYSRSATSVGAASYFGTVCGTIFPDEDDRRIEDFEEACVYDLGPEVVASTSRVRVFDTSKLPELSNRINGILADIVESNFAEREISLNDVRKLIIALGEQNFTGRETASGYLVSCNFGTANTHNPHDGDNAHPSFIADLKKLFLETGVWEYYNIHVVDPWAGMFQDDAVTLTGDIQTAVEDEQDDIVAQQAVPVVDPWADMPPLEDDPELTGVQSQEFEE